MLVVRRALWATLFLAFLSTGALAAPVVVTPGEASSYVYFPAGVTAQGSGGGSETIG